MSLCYTEVTFLPFLWSHTYISSCPSKWKIPFLKQPPPLVCWSVMSAGNEPWIEKSNNLEELVLSYAGCGISSILSNSWYLFWVIWTVWKLALLCCRRVHFLLTSTGFFCCTILPHLLQLFGLQFGINGLPVQNEFIMNYPIVIPWNRASPCVQNTHAWWQVPEPGPFHRRLFSWGIHRSPRLFKTS